MIIHKCGYDKVHSQKEVRYIKNVDIKMTADCGNAKDRRTDQSTKWGKGRNNSVKEIHSVSKNSVLFCEMYL